MQFKREARVEREIDIPAFLLQNFSLSKIALQLAVNTKIIKAYMQNMMQKLNAENIEDSIQSIKAK
jgi:DNA-binding NarL/FixJ family response regulator